MVVEHRPPGSLRRVLDAPAASKDSNLKTGDSGTLHTGQVRMCGAARFCHGSDLGNGWSGVKQIQASERSCLRHSRQQISCRLGFYRRWW